MESPMTGGLYFSVERDKFLQELGADVKHPSNG
jgi:hypothetical protein